MTGVVSAVGGVIVGTSCISMGQNNRLDRSLVGQELVTEWSIDIGGNFRHSFVARVKVLFDIKLLKLFIGVSSKVFKNSCVIAPNLFFEVFYRYLVRWIKLSLVNWSVDWVPNINFLLSSLGKDTLESNLIWSNMLEVSQRSVSESPC